MKSAIIIGASSGIGRALATTLSRDGYRVGDLMQALVQSKIFLGVAKL